MQVLKDQWTPLFEALADRVSVQRRRQLLFNLIGQIYDISYLNFGPNGEHRPSEWPEYRPLYAFLHKGGSKTPTLIDSGQMQNSFKVDIGNDSATLTNLREFASAHQLGDPSRKLPARPFFPVDSNGQLTPYAVEKLNEVLESHFEIQV